MQDNINNEKEIHRHETFLTSTEWGNYQKFCKEYGEGRKPKGQTAHLIRKFMKRCREKKNSKSSGRDSVG